MKKHKNIEAEAYAHNLLMRIAAIKAGLLLTAPDRADLVEDLSALVWFAENAPEVFAKLPKKDS